MARLVEGAEEALVEVARVVARGEPAVAGADPATEGVGGLVQPAGVEVEADGRRGALAEEALAVDGVVTLQDLVGWAAP